MKTPTLFINGRFLSQPLTGVQRYAIALLTAMDDLLASDPAWQSLPVVCLVPTGIDQKPPWQRIQLQPVGINRGNLWEQFDLPLFLRGRFLFSPANLGPWFHRQQAATFHDASIFAVPQAYSFAFRLKYRLGLWLLARQARLLLTDSVFSQRELAHYLSLSPERMQVVPLGADHLAQVAPDESILARLNLEPGQYLLSVASQSPHKNTARLAQAVSRLQGAVRLVLVGGMNQAIFQHDALQVDESRIIRTGYLTDQALVALYQHALAFVFPSLYEGFGLPVLEAMRAGCPVLCSRAASLPEVGGDAVRYFDPLDVDGMAAALDDFLLHPALQAELRSRGLVHAQTFTWRATARQTLDRLLACMK